MSENPNPQPGFIRAGGILGNIVSLTNQVCTRDAPGNIPLVIYDTQATYTSGNGAMVENLIIVPTGTVAKSVLFLFVKDLDTTAISPFFTLYDEIDLPALASVSASAKSASYPLKAPLTRDLYRSLPQVGSLQYPKGLRLNGNSRNFQYAVALGTTIGTAPMYVYIEGGEQ